MARGTKSEVGATRIAKNGYHYTKVNNHPRAQNGWILTHWLTAEKVLGRTLEENEMVKFKDKKFKADPYNEEGIFVIKKRTSSLRRQLANVETRIEELQAERDYLKRQLDEV